MTDWRFEGIRGAFTRYRINEGGLSANVVKQFATWCRVKDRVQELAPDFAKKWTPYAEAYQLRYLSRRSVRMGEGALAWTLIRDALSKCPTILLEEPGKTLTTIMAAAVLRFLPTAINAPLQAAIQRSS